MNKAHSNSYLLTLILAFFYSQAAVAEPLGDSATESTSTSQVEDTELIGDSALMRQNSNVVFEFSSDETMALGWQMDETWRFGVLAGNITPLGFSPDDGTTHIVLFWQLSNSYDTDFIKLPTKGVGVYLRYFTGNSFNIKLALRHNTFSGSTETYRPGSPGKKMLQPLSGNATFMTASLGNEWTFDFGIHIGVDWFSAGTVLSSNQNYGTPTFFGGPTAQDMLDMALANRQATLDSIKNFTGPSMQVYFGITF